MPSARLGVTVSVMRDASIGMARTSRKLARFANPLLCVGSVARVRGWAIRSLLITCCLQILIRSCCPRTDHATVEEATGYEYATSKTLFWYFARWVRGFCRGWVKNACVRRADAPGTLVHPSAKHRHPLYLALSAGLRVSTPRTGRPPGRPAKPVEVKRALGNPGQRPLPAAPTPEFALEVVKLDDVPNPPSTLGIVGLATWDRIWSAGRRHLSDSQDRMLIERLCERMDLVAKLEAWLGEDVERRWYTTANGQVVTHPAVKQIDESDTKITTWLSMLGFSPSDRARLGLAEIRVANELDEYRQRKARVVDSVAVPND